MNPKRTYVLIPGAWHGAWSWHAVARKLEQAGNAAFIMTMPGLSYGDDPYGLTLEDAIAFAAQSITRRGLHQVTVVAHSWAGLPASGTAHRIPERVEKVVYCNAIVPVGGQSMADSLPLQSAQFLHDSASRSTDGTIPLAFDLYQQLLGNEISEDLQHVLYDMTLPQPGGYMLDAFPEYDTPIPEGTESAYLVSHAEKSPGDSVHEAASRLGVVPTLIPGGHMSLITHPEAVASALLRA